MAEKKTMWVVLAVAVIAIFAIVQLMPKASGEASLKVDIGVVEPPAGFAGAIVTGPKTLVDVETVPFSLTIFNDGNTDFTNVRIGEGTIPPILYSAFQGQVIASLPAGASKTLTANVDLGSLAPESGSNAFNFQANVIADYDVAGETFTKYGYSDIMQLTISPGAGLTVTVNY